MFCERLKQARVQANGNHEDSDEQAIHGFVHIYHTKIIAPSQRYWTQNAARPQAGRRKTVTSKAEVISWLKRSLEAVKKAHLAEASDLPRVRVDNRDSTADAMYLRTIIHDNEHMGQLVAYARMTGVVPPWSK
jgi:uncharacterized damage-inducible protein DinB